MTLLGSSQKRHMQIMHSGLPSLTRLGETTAPPLKAAALSTCIDWTAAPASVEEDEPSAATPSAKPAETTPPDETTVATGMDLDAGVLSSARRVGCWSELDVDCK